MVGKRQIQAAEKHLVRNDKKLATLITRHGPCAFQPHRNYYGRLVRGIISQQLSVKAADSIWQRVLEMFGGELPLPEQLLAADPEQLRGCGISYAKISYMKDLAQHVIDGRLDLQHISTLPNKQLIEQLTAVKGMGEWSAHMFMIFTLGRLDILPTGDLGVRKSIRQIYGLSGLPDAAKISA